MKKRYGMPLLFALLTAVILSGCGGKQLPPPKEKVYWPPPPNEVKMEWITTFTTEDDFEKTPQQLAAEKFLGKPKVAGLNKPVSVASLGDGVVYVSDLDAQQVQVVDFNNKTLNVYLKEMPVAQPGGLTIDSRGDLFVVDISGKQVVRFSPQRKVVRNYADAELQKPSYVALDEGRGRLYVSDVKAHKVLVFDLATGAKLFSFGGLGDAVGALYTPTGLAVDKQGNIFVAEQLNARVQVFDSEGRHLYLFGKRTDKTFDFEAPRGLALDSQGNLFVVDVRKSALLIFLPDGTPLSSIGGEATTHKLGFVMPNNIFVDTNDRIYISDGLARRITLWQMLTPAYLAEHPLDSSALKEIEKRVKQLQEKEEQ